LLQVFGVRLGLGAVLAIFVALAVVRSLLNWRALLLTQAIELDFLRDVRISLFSDIARANWSFLRRKRPADLMSSLTNETGRLSTAVYFALQLPARAIIVAAHVVTASLLSLKLTLAAVGTGLLLAWLMRSRLTESFRLGKTLSAANERYYHSITEFFAGLKIAKSYLAENQYVSAFATASDEVRDNYYSFTKRQASARLLQEIVTAGSVAAFLAVSAGWLQMPIAEVLVLALIFYRLLPMVHGLQQSAQQLLHVAPAAEAVLGLSRDCAAEREPSSLDRPRLVMRREIGMDAVFFGHDAAVGHVLKDVSLRLPAGALTVISGPSGAGKSTLLDLLAGLLRPDEGAILIDGVALTDAATKAWRASVAYVLQDPFLFHASIRANMQVSKPDASDDEIEAALRAGGALDFVDALPEGLDTIVGDRGSRFSGGERQRLALSRALLRKPSLLILDEPTSSLDARSEQAVLEEVEALKGRVTMVLVTHRPERFTAADQAFTLEGGRLLRTARSSAPQEA
jgi:ATP-binding cassette subfamily C protein